MSRATEVSWEAFAREVGHNLRQARKVRGLSQEKVAHIAGVAANTYQKYEKGESKPGTPLNPRLTTLIALSQALETPITALLPEPYPDLTHGR